MIIYPAIDLKEGRCVRLHKGAMDSETVYNDNPADQARLFKESGFSWIHIVDLNGAVEGKPVNEDAVKAILQETDLPVQLGGGIRNLEQVENWLKSGVTRVILGTIAIKQPEIMREACKAFPGKIVLGLDAYGQDVATEGWTEKSGQNMMDLVQEYSEIGLEAIIYTDINRDGTGEGINLANTIQLAKSVSVPVIASGGAGSIADVKAVKNAEADGVAGMIIGKALYDGRIDPAEAIKVAA